MPKGSTAVGGRLKNSTQMYTYQHDSLWRSKPLLIARMMQRAALDME